MIELQNCYYRLYYVGTDDEGNTAIGAAECAGEKFTEWKRVRLQVNEGEAENAE